MSGRKQERKDGKLPWAEILLESGAERDGAPLIITGSSGKMAGVSNGNI